jgi:hypothetical protein
VVGVSNKIKMPLPPEILLMICDYLDLETRLKMRLIHKYVSDIEFICTKETKHVRRWRSQRIITNYSSLYDMLRCSTIGDIQSIVYSYSFKGYRNKLRVRYLTLKDDNCENCMEQSSDSD